MISLPFRAFQDMASPLGFTPYTASLMGSPDLITPV